MGFRASVTQMSMFARLLNLSYIHETEELGASDKRQCRRTILVTNDLAYPRRIANLYSKSTRNDHNQVPLGLGHVAEGESKNGIVQPPPPQRKFVLLES